MKNLMKTIVYGTAVGDALGVPVEFIGRERLEKNPVTKMMGMGTHGQVAGTWSDDTSLLLAIADGISDGYDLAKIAYNFVSWYEYDFFTAHEEVFDCGITTNISIHRIKSGNYPLIECGETNAKSQGNGSLMRTLALLPLVHDLPIAERFRIVTEVSRLTHGHYNCQFACFFLVEYAKTLYDLRDKINHNMTQLTSFILTQDRIRAFINTNAIEEDKLTAFARLLSTFETVTEKDISGSGYVMSTLEASIWCIINTNSYSEAVLKAVNLGDDTDTTGAVTGGLATILYGIESIPVEWTSMLANKRLLNAISDGYKGK